MKNKDVFNEKLKYSELFSFYGNLLTDRQRDVFQLYCDQDLSLSEISADLSISRQAVHDAIHRSQQLLGDYEKKLGFCANFQKREQCRTLIKRELNRLDDVIKDKHDKVVKEYIDNVMRLIDNME